MLVVQIHFSRRVVLALVLGALLLIAVPAATAQEIDIAQSIHACPTAAFGLDPPLDTPIPWAAYDVFRAYYVEAYTAASEIERPRVLTAFNKCYLVRVGGFTTRQAAALLAVFPEMHELESQRRYLMHDLYRHENSEIYHHSH